MACLRKEQPGSSKPEGKEQMGIVSVQFYRVKQKNLVPGESSGEFEVL
jgi:hypothetical protein